LNLIRVMPAKGQDIMPTSIFLAKLIGPILLVVAVGVLMNRKLMGALAQEVLGNHALLFLLGFLDFASGLAIVLVHNLWVADWRIIITLLGWLLLVRGARPHPDPGSSQALWNENAERPERGDRQRRGHARSRSCVELFRIRAPARQRPNALTPNGREDDEHP
jgi:hypothetical protein